MYLLYKALYTIYLCGMAIWSSTPLTMLYINPLLFPTLCSMPCTIIKNIYQLFILVLNFKIGMLYVCEIYASFKLIDENKYIYII